MNIELKKLKISLAFSEETTCFQADVYVDGVHMGYASNRGHGGNTNITFVNGQKELYFKAVKYCASLPKHQSEFGPMDMDLEFFIDLLVEKEDHKKQEQANARRLLRDYDKGIVIGVKGSNTYSMITWKGHTVKSLMSTIVGQNMLKKALENIKAKLKPNETIWNTNINF